MAQYAKKTKVSPERTMMEIRAVLNRYKATKFGFIEDEQKVGIAFEMRGRRVRFVLPLPDKKAGNQSAWANGTASFSGGFSQDKYDHAISQRWRALDPVIKAKLESIESGIETFDEAFMAQLVLPTGQTMSDWAAPQIESAYKSGEMPPLLPSGGISR